MTRPQPKDSLATRRASVALPELPQGWCWSTVAEIAASGEQPVLTGPFGSSLGKSDFTETGVPLLTIGCLTPSGVSLEKAFFISSEKAKQLERYQVRSGDLLFSRSASVGRAGLVTDGLGGSIINYHLMRLRLEPSLIDPRFFIYYVRGSAVVTNYLREVNHGATRDGINTNDLLGMPVILPSLTAQRRIVSRIEELLSDLDAGVAALQRAKANLKRYRAAVLKAAVEGQLTAAWRAEHPDTEPASKLLERILTERRQKWESEQLAKFAAAAKDPSKGWKEKYVQPTQPDIVAFPKLPEGWVCATADQITSLITDGEHVTPERSDAGILLLSARNVLDGQLSLGNVDYVSQDVHDQLAKRLNPQAGDVLLSCSGSVGRSCVVPFGMTFSLVRSVAVLRPLRTMGEFISLALRSYLLQRQISEKKTQTAQANIFQGKIRKLVFPLPPIDEQSHIVDEVAERFTQIEAAERSIQNNFTRISRLRQSILERAFAGKLVPQDPTDEPAEELLKRIRRLAESVPLDAAKRPLAKKRSRLDKQKVGQAIAYCITRVKRSHGRTWKAKLLTLGQLHAGISLNWQPIRYEHGPLDDIIYDAERLAQHAGWFNFENPKAKGEHTHYSVTNETASVANQFAELIGERKAAFDRLIDDFDRLNSEDAEIFGTVYCAWNDLLIDGRQVNTDAIVAEFYAWDESKKNFTRAQVLNRICWMKQHGYVPTGNTPRTVLREEATEDKPTKTAMSAPSARNPKRKR